MSRKRAFLTVGLAWLLVLSFAQSAIAAPTVLSVSPPSVANDGAKSLTITGVGFVAGATVKLTKTSQTDIAGTGLTVSAVQITGTFNVTAAAPGAWDVVVTNPDLSTGTCAGCLTVTASAPTVTNVSPSSRGQGASSQTLTITGTNFAHGAILSFSGIGITVNSTSFVSTTSLSANVSVDPAAPAGARNATVTNTDAQSGSCTNCFTVNAAPVPVSVAPPSAGNGGTANLTITGTGFQTGATVLLRRTGQSDIPGTSVVVTPPTTISASFNLTNAAPGTWDVRVSNPDGASGTCSACLLISGSKPTVTAVSPSSRGQGASGVDLSVTGTHFASGAVATFSGAGITVNSTTFVSSTEVTANVSIGSAAATGLRDVTVTNTDTQSGTCTGCFTVNAKPVVSSATPSSRGQGASNQNITIGGSGFVSGASLASSFSGTGITVNSTTFVSGTELTANISISSSATTGLRDVTVTNGDAGVGSCVACFTVNVKPTGITPAPSSRGQGATSQVITITGAGFSNGPTLAVTFSGTGITVNSTVWVSAVQITANITVSSSATTGTRDITVTNGDAGVGSCSSCFTVNGKPVVTSATPSSRGQGATGQNITIGGSGFVAGASLASSFSGTGITVNSTTFVSGTELTVNIDVAGGATLEPRNVTVTNGDAGVGSCTACFTVNAKPTATSATPSSRGQGATDQDITVNGTGFLTGAAVTFSGLGITVNSTTFVSATELTANIDVSGVATVSARDVTVTNPDGATPAVCAGCFTVNAKPVVSSTTPSSRGQGASNQNISIGGSGFVAGAPLAASFSGGGITVNSTTWVSGTELTVNIDVASSAVATARNVTVTNGDAGVGSCVGCFTVNTGPVPTSATPPAASNTGEVSLTIAGSGFVVGPPASTVLLQRTGQPDIAGTDVVVGSSSSMTASFDLTDAAPGAWNVVVTNPDGGQGSCACFSVAASAPTVTSATPSSRGQGASGEDITVAGTNFANGAAVTFSGAGITVNSTTFVSPTELTANIDVASGATPGARNVIVTNTDTQAGSCTGCFTVNAKPTVTSASPNSRGQGATNQDITINGTNFLTGAAVTFSGTGITVNSTTFVSATTLTANIDIAPNAATTARDVTVTNPDGGTPAVCAGCFTVLAPTLTGVSPSSRGQGATNQNLTLTGTGFLSGAVATFSGTGITVNSTTFVSSTTLTVNVDIAPNASTSSARNVTVTNPGGGTPATCLGCFLVTAAPVVNSAFPDYAARAASQRSITITGSGFDVGTTIGFSGSGITVNSLSRSSSSLLTIKISVASNAAVGLRSITVTDSHAGTSTCVGCFTVIRFGDVTPGFFAFDAIETIAVEGITGGCSISPPLYCPNADVTRAQMAVFILRAMGHGDPSHLPAYRGIFADVPASNPYARFIEHLYDHGITGGCGTSPRRYCPNDSVTRGQMAVFLLRAIGHGSSAHLGSYQGTFADVPSSNPFARFIEHLYSPHGVTSGCATNPLRYCPNADVTRAQMAIFLVRTFGL
jgi:hypothetical protein